MVAITIAQEIVLKKNMYYRIKTKWTFNIKNRTCYYFDDIIRIKDFNFDNFFLDEKSYENILIYDISYKTLIGAKPLLVRFNKIERFIRVYDGTRYLVLFGGEKYDFIYNRIRYLLGVVWRMFFLIIAQKLKLIHIILCL